MKPTADGGWGAPLTASARPRRLLLSCRHFLHRLFQFLDVLRLLQRRHLAFDISWHGSALASPALGGYIIGWRHRLQAHTFVAELASNTSTHEEATRFNHSPEIR